MLRPSLCSKLVLMPLCSAHQSVASHDLVGFPWEHPSYTTVITDPGAMYSCKDAEMHLKVTSKSALIFIRLTRTFALSASISRLGQKYPGCSFLQKRILSAMLAESDILFHVVYIQKDMNLGASNCCMVPSAVSCHGAQLVFVNHLIKTYGVMHLC